MTAAAYEPTACRRNPDAVTITLRLTQRQVTLLYGWTCLAQTIGTTATGTIAADEDRTAAMLHNLACRLYVALRDSTVRSGL